MGFRRRVAEHGRLAGHVSAADGPRVCAGRRGGADGLSGRSNGRAR
ncbi:Thiamin-phosphate pyrophosphorylase [Caballeronia sordidicola]|uniref:Thiamin-phosphate pyrophosphorylase n=1 Tax=Caballeronia sordidicola TaxID=196367 RepID=A0A242M9Q7_CABSO|nr:Thiamin-phosphate pyrophosphorylase [Caballeronia sordidicola]